MVSWPENPRYVCLWTSPKKSIDTAFQKKTPFILWFAMRRIFLSFNICRG